METNLLLRTEGRLGGKIKDQKLPVRIKGQTRRQGWGEEKVPRPLWGHTAKEKKGPKNVEIRM